MKVVSYVELSLRMNFNVKTLTGRKLQFNMEPTDTISLLAEKITEIEGIDKTQLRMVHNGRQLSIVGTFADAKIMNGDTIHIILALRGG